MKEIKRRWPLFIAGIICLFIVMGHKAPVNLWQILHFFPPYSSQTTPSRYILGVVFCISIFSGIGTSYLEQFVLRIKNIKRKLIFQLFLLGAMLFIFLDLYFVNSPILNKAFVNSPIYLEKQKTFRQRYIKLEFPGFRSLSAMYPVVLSNSGIINSYEVIAVEQGEVKTVNDADYRGEAYLVNNNGRVSIKYFSPNKIILDIDTVETNRVVLNQNYFNGWRIIDNDRRSKIDVYHGLISTILAPGHHRVTFYYLPLSFIIGSFVSVGFILTVMLYYQKIITVL